MRTRHSRGYVGRDEMQLRWLQLREWRDVDDRRASENGVRQPVEAVANRGLLRVRVRVARQNEPEWLSGQHFEPARGASCCSP